MSRVFRWGAAVLAVAAVLVTSGAAVPSPVTGMDRFYRQQPKWKPCAVETLDAAGGSCAAVRVPLDYADPDGRTLNIAISRVPATDPDRRRGVLLADPGGPGASGLDTVDLLGDVLAPEVRAQYDLIGMDPRGVGRSDGGRTCGWPIGEMIRSAGVGRDGFLTDTARAARLAMACLTGDSAALRQLTTRNTARDMEVIRRVLGEPSLSYYGVSYGTYLGAVFAQLFPRSVDRMVLDSAIDPDRYWNGMVHDWGAADEAALDDWAGWAARRDPDYHFGTTAAQVRGAVEQLMNDIARQPITVNDFVIDDHWLPFLLHNLLGNFRLNEKMADTVAELRAATGATPPAGHTPWLTDTLDSLRQYEDSALAFVACGDDAAPEDPVRYWSEIEQRRATQPIFGALAANIQPCAFWPRPVESITAVRNSVSALIVQATGDPRTPYDHALALHRDLSASRLVTLADVRIHMTFRPGLSRCVGAAINGYFADGVFPATDVVCAPDTEAEP
ncbi:alpha/beta fold hydrolase [Nocardia cerradoensis]|uniref:alpha/beta fold hydrolase n=1 Tax=Nocardia cerradoensis TaxID=85688 RepID=UPI0005849393|nr:alpha/beta fold hydrolase [Nocardia cerradoensis]NKY44754.1 alpha/beta hydrolase [Nocardia cerradoensis]